MRQFTSNTQTVRRALALFGSSAPMRYGAFSKRRAENRWPRLAVVLCCAALLVPVAQPCLAASLTLSSSAPPGSALHVLPQAESAPMTIGVSNEVSTDPPSEFLAAWQLRLRIEPQAGAIGTVEFASATQPDQYVFDDASSLGIAPIDPGIEVSTQDINFPYSGGVQVPDGAGVDLLSVTFQASAGTYGSFDVLAVGGAGNSRWTDAAEPVQQSRAFDNVPSSGSPIRIAELIVGLAGDYNENGIVDAADYVVWRDNLGRPDALPNDDTSGVGPDDYARWKTNFGQSVGGGTAATMAGTATHAPSAAPEPTSFSLAAFVLACASGRRHPRDRFTA